MLGVTTGRYFDFISSARLPRTIRHLSMPRALPFPVDLFDSKPDSLPPGTSYDRKLWTGREVKGGVSW
jgi:hypothetical protein